MLIERCYGCYFQYLLLLAVNEQFYVIVLHLVEAKSIYNVIYYLATKDAAIRIDDQRFALELTIFPWAKYQIEVKREEGADPMRSMLVNLPLKPTITIIKHCKPTRPNSPIEITKFYILLTNFIIPIITTRLYQ